MNRGALIKRSSDDGRHSTLSAHSIHHYHDAKAVIRSSKCFGLSEGIKQRLLQLTTGSFLEVQFLRFADRSAVIHDGPRRT